jgi:riboflavin kinase/FMN adenylyltransferase
MRPFLLAHLEARISHMQVVYGLDALAQLPAGSVLSVGNFDGVHRGHACILAAARQRQALLPGSSIVIVTFEPHPLTVLRPALAPPRLSSAAEKQVLLAAQGADYLAILPPTPQTLGLTAEQFWAILRDQTRPRHMIEGSSFNFGKNRGGDIGKLRQWSAGTAVQLQVIDPVCVPLLNLHVLPVTSSAIRWLLANGRVRDAAICLGRPYSLQGPVIKGFGRGAKIGIPTANLQCLDQLIPADGVYAARCDVDGIAYPIALSIGTMPTFGSHDRQIEAHLIGFAGDLYGRQIRLEILDWLRDQRKFPSVQALKDQLAADIATSAARAGMDAQRQIAK